MNRTDIYQKYIVTRTDGREVPEAVYFVLRIDRIDHWWDRVCRMALGRLALDLKKDGDPNKNKFGASIEKWIVDSLAWSKPEKAPSRGE